MPVCFGCAGRLLHPQNGMKIELAGPENRGLATGLNEAAGYSGRAYFFNHGLLSSALRPQTGAFLHRHRHCLRHLKR